MNVFDIVGPVMIGPSSSHTAGACRLGFIARALLGEAPVSAHILLHGSFAKTYRGHGTDKALIAGILGMLPDDADIRNSLQIAQKKGLSVELVPTELTGAHPNTAVITLTGQSGKKVRMEGASIGGGNVRITQVDGMNVEITGQYPTLIVLHRDVPGLIASVSELVSAQGVNINNFRLSRDRKGGLAVMSIEMDSAPSADLFQKVASIEDVISVTKLDSLA